MTAVVGDGLPAKQVSRICASQLAIKHTCWANRSSRPPQFTAAHPPLTSAEWHSHRQKSVRTSCSVCC
jgi:hypothetical protein